MREAGRRVRIAPELGATCVGAVTKDIGDVPSPVQDSSDLNRAHIWQVADQVLVQRDEAERLASYVYPGMTSPQENLGDPLHRGFVELFFQPVGGGES